MGENEHACMPTIRRKAQKVAPGAPCAMLQSEKRHKKPPGMQKCAKKHHMEADNDTLGEASLLPYSTGWVPLRSIPSAFMKS
jgi:hypothetical protein